MSSKNSLEQLLINCALEVKASGFAGFLQMKSDRDQAIVERLLSSDEPSIRLETRIKIVGEPTDSKAIIELRDAAKKSARVRLLLSERNKNGELPWHPYAKWYGAHWVLSILADLGYPKGDEALIPLREQVYEWLFSKAHLQYVKRHEAFAGPVMKIRGLYRAHASIEGNALYYISTLGLADDRTKLLADRLVEWQWPDGGWNCDKEPSAHASSFTESLLPLRGLAAFSKITTSSHQAEIRHAAEYFLQRKLFRRMHDGRIINPKFAKLHYPCYWHYDILFGLKVITEAGFIGDERCDEALSLLESKRLKDGGFPAEEAYYKSSRRATTGRSLVGWGGVSKRKMNEFVTCETISVMSQAYLSRNSQ